MVEGVVCDIDLLIWMLFLCCGCCCERSVSGNSSWKSDLLVVFGELKDEKHPMLGTARLLMS